MHARTRGLKVAQDLLPLHELQQASHSLTSCVTTDDVLMCKTCYSKQRGPVGYGYGGALASETQGKA